jgi:hypothetical protein
LGVDLLVFFSDLAVKPVHVDGSTVLAGGTGVTDLIRVA